MTLPPAARNACGSGSTGSRAIVSSASIRNDRSTSATSSTRDPSNSPPHVVQSDIDDPVPDPTARYWPRCFVTKRVLAEVFASPTCIARRPTVRTTPAGESWPETNPTSTLRTPKNIAYVSLGAVLRKDDSFRHLLETLAVRLRARSRHRTVRSDGSAARMMLARIALLGLREVDQAVRSCDAVAAAAAHDGGSARSGQIDRGMTALVLAEGDFDLRFRCLGIGSARHDVDDPADRALPVHH